MSAKNPMHPGEFIMGAYIEPMELTASSVADALGVHRGTFSRLLNGKTDITPEMAMRLSDVLGGSPESWINMQMSYTLARLRSSKDWLKKKPTSPIEALEISEDAKCLRVRKATSKRKLTTAGKTSIRKRSRVAG